MMKYALPPLVDSASKILILGTMPGERSIALQQYYGNRGNQFWRILFQIFDEPFSVDYADRTDLLQRQQVALWNVLADASAKAVATTRYGMRSQMILLLFTTGGLKSNMSSLKASPQKSIMIDILAVCRASSIESYRQPVDCMQPCHLTKSYRRGRRSERE